MTEYIVILPDDAQSWMILLSDTFFHALTPKMQSDMMQHDFKMSLASRGLTKSKQLGALNDIQTATSQSHKRNFIANKAISKQV